MSRPLLLSSILAICVAAPIHAAPMLLVEFSHSVNAVETEDPLPAAVPFGIYAGEESQPPYFIWREEYPSSAIGTTFLAPAQVVEGANQAIASATTGYLLETGPANFSSGGSHFLMGNTVTSVERIIDQLVITRTQGDFYVLEAAQRIRFWGVPIPEANAIVSFIVGFTQCTLIAIRRQRRT
jgi:hypothetical protein